MHKEISDIYYFFFIEIFLRLLDMLLDWLLTFALLGGGVVETPLRFFQIVQKRRRAAPPFLAHLIIHLFRTCCENFRPRSRKVRSPSHVK